MHKKYFTNRTFIETLRGGIKGNRSENVDTVNMRRRSLLKWAALSSGAFVLGKILGPSFSLFGDSETLGKTHLFKNFRVVESSGELGFYDGLGNEILVLEKDPNAGE